MSLSASLLLDASKQGTGNSWIAGALGDEKLKSGGLGNRGSLLGNRSSTEEASCMRPITTLSLLPRMDAIKRKMQAMKVELLKTSLLSSLTHTWCLSILVHHSTILASVKSTQIRDKMAKISQSMPQFCFLIDAKEYTGLKKVHHHRCWRW